MHDVSIIDSNSLSREGLKHVLRRRCFRIAENWSNIEEAIKAAPTGADRAAILINLARRALPSPQVLNRLCDVFPGARLVLIGESLNSARIQAAAQAGFDGFLLETINPEALSKSVELIVLGERIFPVTQWERLARRECDAVEVAVPSLATLSAGETRVLALLAKACSNKVIARELGISESTVKVHVKAILRKTGARNRTDVALMSRDVEARALMDSVSLEPAAGATVRLN